MTVHTTLARGELPAQLTSFVGRGDELAAVERLLAAERLVTLTGPGGCGKTRLAIRAAAELADRWPAGAWWVDLGPVTDPAIVADLVASTLGVLVEPVAGPLRALAVQLRDRELLVCLDNCEHVLDPVAEVVETMLLACPGVSVMATSREPLGVAAETVWRVPSMAEDEAVTLFVERARRVRPWFDLGGEGDDGEGGGAESDDAEVVRTLCRRLDGIPLAIELAAAWLGTLTPAQVVAGLDDRFALLVRGPRGVIPRQQTLAASLEWSHDLLDEVDRVAFRRLAVFSGGFSLEAARAVCGFDPLGEADVLAALARLVDASLVVVEDRRGEARYRLLETIKQYAQGRLSAAGEAARARDRQLDHMLAFAEVGAPELGDADAWLARIDVEHGNMRTALDWGLAAESPERARRLAAALFWFWYLHGHPQEGIDYIQQALDRAPGERSTTQATLLAGLAAVAIGSRRYTLVIESAQRGIDVATEIGDERNRGRCFLLLSAIQQYLDHEAARELLASAREAAEKAGDTFVLDRVLVMEGLLWSSGDDHERALPALAEGYRRCLARQDRGFTTLALDWQADAAQHRGDLAEAHRLASAGLEQARPLGDYFSVGHSTSHLAHVKGLMGDIEGGRALMAPVIRSVENTEQDVFVPRMARALGSLSLATGDFEAAIRWCEADARFGGPMAESRVVARVLPVMAAAHRRLGRLEEAQALVDRGLAMSRKVGIPHLVAEALDEGGHIALARGDAEGAEDLFHQALTERVERGLRLGSVDSLDALAGLALLAEGHAEAARLFAAADAARTALGYPRPPVDRPAHEAAVGALRAALGEAAFAAAWGEGSALSLEDAVALVRRARGTRGRPSHGWASLTPTELQVVKAVVDGLNNPEIGARLFMSRGTVKTHLSHIYAKLDIANRTELARVATPRLAE